MTVSQSLQGKRSWNKSRNGLGFFVHLERIIHPSRPRSANATSSRGVLFMGNGLESSRITRQPAQQSVCLLGHLAQGVISTSTPLKRSSVNRTSWHYWAIWLVAWLGGKFSLEGMLVGRLYWLHPLSRCRKISFKCPKYLAGGHLNYSSKRCRIQGPHTRRGLKANLDLSVSNSIELAFSSTNCANCSSGIRVGLSNQFRVRPLSKW